MLEHFADQSNFCGEGVSMIIIVDKKADLLVTTRTNLLGVLRTFGSQLCSQVSVTTSSEDVSSQSKAMSKAVFADFIQDHAF